MEYRLAVLDGPGPGGDADAAIAGRNALRSDSSRAAIYYPWLEVLDADTGARYGVPPSGAVAGLYARLQVHEAPTGEALKNVAGVADELPAEEAESLNEAGVNCVRVVGDGDVAVCGARTLSSDSAYKYVAVRRLLIYLERSIKLGTRWVVREPNDNILWARVRQTIGVFLADEWREGALKGAAAEEAFFVRCDRTTMTEAAVAEGRVVFEVGVAPLKPGEFVVFRVTQAKTFADVREL